MKIFIITLFDSKERQAGMRNQLDKYNLKYEFIFGVDGRKLTKNEIDNLYDSNKAKLFKNELNYTEIGCSLSHKLVYEKMINENIDRAIVLEDGISLLPDFFSIINFFDDIKIDKFIIKLDRCYSGQKNNDNFKSAKFTHWHRIKLTENYYIGQPFSNPYLTGAYYIDKNAAQVIYSLMPKIFLVADGWWFFRKIIKLRVINTALTWRDWAYIPSIVSHKNDIKQTMNEEMLLLKYFKKVIYKIKRIIEWFLLFFK